MCQHTWLFLMFDNHWNLGFLVLPDLNQWQASPQQNDFVSSAGHASKPHPSEDTGQFRAPPHATSHFDLPPPLPLQHPHPALRAVGPTPRPHTNMYKPYQDSRVQPNQSPKPKHKHVTLPADTRTQPQQFQRQQFQSNEQSQYGNQSESHPGHTKPIPVREFINNLEQDLRSPPASGSSFNKQQYGDYHRQQRQQDLQKGQQLPKTRTSYSQHHHSLEEQQNRPALYTHPQHEQVRHLPHTNPLSPPFRSPAEEPHAFPGLDSPTSPSKNIYRPSTLNQILRRGSPTPSLPGDFRQKQPSPTPSVASTSSEYILSGGRGRSGKSRGMNLFFKQQERLAAMGADVQGSRRCLSLFLSFLLHAWGGLCPSFTC